MDRGVERREHGPPATHIGTGDSDTAVTGTGDSDTAVTGTGDSDTGDPTPTTRHRRPDTGDIDTDDPTPTTRHR